jgi:hypothetical protein
MKGTTSRLPDRAFVLLLAAAAFFLAVRHARPQAVQHLTIAQPGGMPGLPIITGIERGSNSTRVTWDGPSGYYQLLQKKKVTSPAWQPVGGPTLARQAIVTNTSSSAIFRVAGPAPQYAGAQACAECHEKIYRTEMNTPHPHALEVLTRIHQDTNPNCLPCHTVGYGVPTGFSSVTNFVSTNQLAGVQCENCHGPAGNHAANENDSTVRPRVELAAAVCGGCHDGSHNPTYAEWQTSSHAQVPPDVLAFMATSTNNLSGCGRCHSASVRLSLMKGDRLPVGDANVPIVCATCHDPHATHVWTNVLSGEVTTNQLRNPVASTNDYFLTTSASFAKKYNPNVNLCAQCHNHRGASWTNTFLPPHPSPQYNMLLGTVGVLPGNTSPSQPASHALMIDKQCVGCHMQTAEFQDGPPEVPAVTGHRFTVDSYNVCLDCHPFPEMLADFTQSAIWDQLQNLKADLDFWARTKAPPQLWTNYGVRSWEYTIPGTLSNPADVTAPGPSTEEQSLIPTKIKKARFNAYVVLYDGSFGVHNAPYCASLLEAAENWVQAELRTNTLEANGGPSPAVPGR